MKFINTTFFLIFILFPFIVGAQLQPGECGLKFSYDATGSLIKREYICNNGPGVITRQGLNLADGSIANSEKGTTDVISVNAIMPNPTTGRFTVSLTKPVADATITLLNASGRILEKKKHSGNTVSFDINNRASGVYYVRIEQGTASLTFKVIKR